MLTTAHHVTSRATLWRTYAALMVLMVATVLAAVIPHTDHWLMSWFSNVLAMTIAISKAILVILFFMGVKYSSGLVKIFAVLGFAWFLLLFVLYADYATRPWEPVRGWEKTPPTGLPRFPAADRRESTEIGKQPGQ